MCARRSATGRGKYLLLHALAKQSQQDLSTVEMFSWFICNRSPKVTLEEEDREREQSKMNLIANEFPVGT